MDPAPVPCGYPFNTLPDLLEFAVELTTQPWMLARLLLMRPCVHRPPRLAGEGSGC